ncbi:MAG: Clp protease N-terminal domain-containing protein, partial [Sulfurifustaceae bacterium]
MLSQELEFSLNAAFQSARERRHEFITVEHLLMALLDNPSASRVIRACGGNIEELRRNLLAFLNENVPVLPPNSKIDTQPTIGFQRVIQRAVLHVQGVGKKEVTGANVLVAIF